MTASSSTGATRRTGDDGRIRFTGLEPVSSPDFTGEMLDLSGTIEWSCGPAA